MSRGPWDEQSPIHHSHFETSRAHAAPKLRLKTRLPAAPWNGRRVERAVGGAPNTRPLQGLLTHQDLVSSSLLPLSSRAPALGPIETVRPDVGIGVCREPKATPAARTQPID